MNLRNTKNISLIFLSVFFIVSNCENNSIQLLPGLTTTCQMRYLGHDGYRKVLYFLLSIPNNYTSEGKFPLVIILHENGNKAESTHNFWKTITDSIGYILLTPQGEGLSTDGEGFVWGRNAYQSILKCLDYIQKDVSFDPRRVYIIGYKKSAKIVNELCLNNPEIFSGMGLLNIFLYGKSMPKITNKMRQLSIYIFGYTDDKNMIKYFELNIARLKQEGFKIRFILNEKIYFDFNKLDKSQLVKMLNFLDNKEISSDN